MLRHTPSQTIPDFLPAAQFSRMMADWYSYGIPHLKYLFWKQIAHVLYDALYKSFFVGWHNYTDSSMFLNLPFASRTCRLVEFICKHIQRVFGNQWPHIPLSDWPNPSQLTVSNPKVDNITVGIEDVKSRFDPVTLLFIILNCYYIHLEVFKKR